MRPKANLLAADLYQMNCPNCQTANPEGARFCMNCGTSLAAESIQAGGFNLDRYIPPELMSKLRSAHVHEGKAGERRIITILFCDVKGSTAAAEQLDPEEWTEIMNNAFEYMIRPIYKYEGFVPRLMGDAILAFFGAPIAHEDDPQRAVLAALDIQSKIEPYSKQIQEEKGIRFKVRVGINTGLVVVGEVGSDLRMEYTAIGDAINLAARMEQTAEPGMIQVSEETYKLIAPFFEFETLGESLIQGKAVPIRTYRVVSIKEAPGQLRGVQGLSSPLVGREVEMELLESRLHSLVSGQGAFVAVMGEAGLGKTSLLNEAHRRVGEQLQPQWLEGHALSYAQSISYFSWRQIIRQSIGARENDTPSEVRGKLQYVCSGCSLPGGDTAFLEAMLAIESEQSLKEVSSFQGEALVQRMIEAVRAYICGLARQTPLVIVLDDMHWMDAASLALLTNLADLVLENPILLIGLSRPDQELASWDSVDQIHQKLTRSFAQINLHPLAQDQTNKLLVNLLGLQGLPGDLLKIITEKSDGNPFFIEEIIRSLIETGQIVRENSHWIIPSEIKKISLPNTLTGLLNARIDRLTEETKYILQIASVIGRSFEQGLLSAITDSKFELEAHLRKLEQAGLITLEANPAQACIFRHALVLEAAYHSMLLKRRRELHQRLGIILEDTYADRVEEFAPVLAHHFFTAEDPRSLKYDVLAGDSAARLYANAEAAIHYTHAIETAKRGGIELNQIAELYAKNGGALEQSGQYDLALANYKEFQAFAHQHSEVPMEISALTAQATIYSTFTSLHNSSLAEDMNMQAIDLARAIGDRGTQAKLHWNLMLTFLFSKRVSQAKYHGELALRAARELGNHEQLAFVLNDLARVYTCLGEFDQAYPVVEEARQLWRELDNQAMLADSFGAEAEARHAAAEFEKMIELLHQGLFINEKIENLWGQSYGKVLLHIVYFDRGQADLAVQMANESILLGDKSGLLASSIALRCDLAWAYACYGGIEKGFAIAKESLSIIEKKNPDWKPISTAVMIRLALLGGDLHSAEAYAGNSILQAISIPYPHYTIVVGLANVELALARGNFEGALALVEGLLAEVLPLTRAGIPEVLYTKAKALLGLERIEEAHQILIEARSMAAGTGSNQPLWRILTLSAEVEQQLGHDQEAESMRMEARRVVNLIADRLEGIGLRGSFLKQAKI
jgi:class 3 adenylate cyclase/tetratricopeptide (TPR) repeat protein